MSANLYWRPVPSVIKDHDLPDALKYALSPRVWKHDGTLSAKPTIITKVSIPYLEGLVDGGVNGAQELIDAIKKNDGQVEIYISQ
jgi:hypothetical protein